MFVWQIVNYINNPLGYPFFVLLQVSESTRKQMFCVSMEKHLTRIQVSYFEVLYYFLRVCCTSLTSILSHFYSTIFQYFYSVFLILCRSYNSFHFPISYSRNHSLLYLMPLFSKGFVDISFSLQNLSLLLLKCCFVYKMYLFPPISFLFVLLDRCI